MYGLVFTPLVILILIYKTQTGSMIHEINCAARKIYLYCIENVIKFVIPAIDRIDHSPNIANASK